jgi:nucleotide-binding universal stress UspA family protein
MAKKRRSLELGRTRKLLVLVDETPEVYCALFYAAGRVQQAGGRLQLLYVIELESQFWDGVRQAQIEEQTDKARALFRLFRRELKNRGFDGVITEEVIREGKKAEEILKQIDEDEDVSVFVLGALAEAVDPNPLVAAFNGAPIARFPIPVTIVPGDSAIEDIKALAQPTMR